ncbi:Cytochrome c-type biogenesis protein CycK, partial [Pseudolycoriella hygida]
WSAFLSATETAITAAAPGKIQKFTGKNIKHTRATLKVLKNKEKVIGTEEVRGVIEHYHQEGNVYKADRDMLEDLPKEEIIQSALSCPHTRIPLWKDAQDNIIGVLHTRDLFRVLYENNNDLQKVDIANLINKPWFIPDNAFVTHQLNAFREKKNHFACVVDEYGELQGIITLEDILEEIVGPIIDEHDYPINIITKQSETEFIIDGSATIRDVNRELNWNLSDKNATTIAGLIIHTLKRIPNQGESNRKMISNIVYGFIISDFSIQNVFLNSSTLKPLIFKIAASWASHEGSILLWLCLFQIIGVVYILFLNHYFSDSKLENDDNDRKISLIILSLIQIMFGSFIYFTSNPFTRLSFHPVQGLGLNPMLQDLALIIHPPMLYLGYVSYSGAFISACSILFNSQNSYIHLKIIKIFANLAILFLTVGVALGSWWAYRELGWGGFWFFDPVENISLLPWLSGIVLYHSVKMTMRNNYMANCTIYLSIITFLIAIFSSFLVRSGLIASIHSFASSQKRAIYMLIIFAIIAIPSLLLFISYGFISGSVTLFSIFLIISICYLLLEKICNRPRRINVSMLLGHLGFGLLALTITLNSLLQSEIDFIGKIGDKITNQDLEITLRDIKVATGPNYYRQIAEFWVQDKQNNLTILKPENRFYIIEKQLSQESNLYSYLAYDLYAVLNKIDEETIHAKIYYKPLMSFIWISAMIMVGGFLIGLCRLNSDE